MTTTAYKKSALTGGGATALDGIDGAGLLDGDFAYIMASNALYVYQLDDDLASGERAPEIIVPDSNAGTKCWVLQAALDRQFDCENISSAIFYPAITGDLADTQSSQTLTNKTLTSPIISNATASRVAIYDGSKVLGSGTNTDAQISDAVSKAHTQNTDTGTTSTSFKINTGGSEADIQTTGLTADRDYTLPDIDTMLAGSVLTTQCVWEIIEYTP